MEVDKKSNTLADKTSDINKEQNAIANRKLNIVIDKVINTNKK